MGSENKKKKLEEYGAIGNSAVGGGLVGYAAGNKIVEGSKHVQNSKKYNSKGAKHLLNIHFERSPQKRAQVKINKIVAKNKMDDKLTSRLKEFNKKHPNLEEEHNRYIEGQKKKAKEMLTKANEELSKMKISPKNIKRAGVGIGAIGAGLAAKTIIDKTKD
jgi:outer membrane murein-binding lipoprotein Lpp